MEGVRLVVDIDSCLANLFYDKYRNLMLNYLHKYIPREYTLGITIHALGRSFANLEYKFTLELKIANKRFTSIPFNIPSRGLIDEGHFEAYLKDSLRVVLHEMSIRCKDKIIILEGDDDFKTFVDIDFDEEEFDGELSF